MYVVKFRQYAIVYFGKYVNWTCLGILAIVRVQNSRLTLKYKSKIRVRKDDLTQIKLVNDRRLHRTIFVLD